MRPTISVAAFADAGCIRVEEGLLSYYTGFRLYASNTNPLPSNAHKNRKNNVGGANLVQPPADMFGEVFPMSITVTRIELSNFRSFKELAIDLGPVNVLVGPNMSGKTNFIDAFRFLSDVVAPSTGGHYGISKAFNSRFGFAEVSWKGGSADVISFKLSGQLNTPSLTGKWVYAIDILGEIRFGSSRVQKETLHITSADGRVVELIATDAAQRLMLRSDGKVVSSLADSTRSVFEYELPDWEGNEIRALFRSARFYRLIPAAMRQMNASSATSFLTETGDNFSAWLLVLQTRYQEQFLKLRAIAQEVFPQIQDLFTFPTQQSTVFVSSREKYLQRPTAIWQMSEGELCFLALLSLILAPSELSAPIFLLEEPENHLHPRLIAILMELYRQDRADRGDDTAQLIVSSHSPYLIDKFSLDEILLFHREAGATKVARASDTAHLRKALEDNTIGLGDLYLSGALSNA